jgi:ATP synthase protein I
MPKREVYLLLHSPCMLVLGLMPFHNPIPERRPRGKAAVGFDSLVQAEKLLQVAFVLPSAMVIGWLAGAWADAKLHQSWLTLAGVIFGCISGLFYVVRMAIDAEKGAGTGPAKEESGAEKEKSQDTK